MRNVADGGNTLKLLCAMLQMVEHVKIAVRNVADGGNTLKLLCAMLQMVETR